MIDRVFLAHPRRVGETYTEHARIALRFGCDMALAGIKCMIHAVIPALFPTVASDKVRALGDEMAARRHTMPDQSFDYVI